MVDLFAEIDKINDVKTLRELRNMIDAKIRENRQSDANPWKKSSFKMVWNTTSKGIRSLITLLANNDGALSKDEILEQLEWTDMQLVGTLAGCNNRARNMHFQDLITKQTVDGKATYKLNEGVAEFVQELTG